MFLNVIAVFVLVVGGSATAQAQSILEQMRKPMPEVEAISQDAFYEQTKVHEDVPLGLDALSYKIRLPKTWTLFSRPSSEAASLNKKVLLEAARFYGPSNFGARSYFSLKVGKLEHEMMAEQWLALFMVENGYTVEGFHVMDENLAGSAYVRLDGDVTYVVRNRVRINGPYIIVAEYVIPLEEWGKHKALVDASLRSFDMLEDADGHAETLETYRFFDIAEAFYPESWELQTDNQRSIDRMYIELLNLRSKNKYTKTKTLKGKIDVHLISEYVVDDLESEIESFKDAYQEGDLIVNELLSETQDFVTNDYYDFAKTYVYDAADERYPAMTYELWINVSYARGYYYFTALTTPSRDKDFSTWVRNTQTFKLVNKLVRPFEEGTLINPQDE